MLPFIIIPVAVATFYFLVGVPATDGEVSICMHRRMPMLLGIDIILLYKEMVWFGGQSKLMPTNLYLTQYNVFRLIVVRGCEHTGFVTGFNFCWIVNLKISTHQSSPFFC